MDERSFALEQTCIIRSTSAECLEKKNGDFNDNSVMPDHNNLSKCAVLDKFIYGETREGKSQASPTNEKV